MTPRSASFPPLGDTGIRQVERRPGITLPEDLAAFYRAHNGGRLHPDLFVKGNDGFGVQIALPMLSGDPNIGFEETYEALVRDTPGFPRGCIPFAAEEGGIISCTACGRRTEARSCSTGRSISTTPNGSSCRSRRRWRRSSMG